MLVLAERKIDSEGGDGVLDLDDRVYTDEVMVCRGLEEVGCCG